MSSNLLKFRGNGISPNNNTRIIDTNHLMAQRIEALSIKTSNLSPEETFEEGIAAEITDVDALFEDNANQPKGNVIKVADSTESLERKALEEANAMLSDAQTKVNLMREEAQAECTRILEEARKKGYEEGKAKALREIEQERANLRTKAAEMEEEYNELLANLEPQFIDHLTSIYEHIFKVDLSSNREVLEYLINTSMRKIENSRSFLLHVSKEDYPYVSMRKQQLLGGATLGDASMEIIEDITLKRNECLIETENGIFDCSLGTQLTELAKKMKLLSYQSR